MCLSHPAFGIFISHVSCCDFGILITSKKQFATVDDVPASYFRDHRTIYGYVERVIDGDTIRIRHCPGYVPWWYGGKPPKSLQPSSNMAPTTKPKRVALSGITLSIRVYGVDCPETAKPNKGQPAQPYAMAAKDFTTARLLHKMVKIVFLRRDQYRRAVAEVTMLGPNRPVILNVDGVYHEKNSWTIQHQSRDISMALAREGLAELYTGGGAEYNVRVLPCYFCTELTLYCF
jgi:endonuclease YncB( thermonuclease family)